MARWECIVCGWVYDEEKGWPDDGIAPGTPWEQVPEDFLCPECGAPKEDFVLLDSPEHIRRVRRQLITNNVTVTTRCALRVPKPPNAPKQWQRSPSGKSMA